MSTDRPYTDADVETVAEVWLDFEGRAHGWPPEPLPEFEREARAVLDALTDAGWMRGHCPGCECPDVPYDGAPPTHRLFIAPEGGEQTWRCPKCGSDRRVGWRAGPEHDGYPLRAQCVPCGHVHVPYWGGEQDA